MQKHKIWSFLLALLAAIVLWVYVVTVENPDDKVSIRGVPVRVIGANELQMNGLMLTGGEIQYVDVEVAGRRSDLKELNNTTLEAVADAGKIDGPGTYELSWVLDPPSTVASGDIKLVSSSNNKIKVKVSEYVNRLGIPVEIEYTGSTAEGFVRDPAMVNLETVPVSGPLEELDKIHRARVIVDLADTKESLDRELPYELVGEDGQTLSLSPYVTVHEEVLRVRVPVFCYKQLQLQLELIDGGGARGEHVKYTIDPPSIGVIGEESVLKDMDSQLLIKTIKLSELTDSLSFTVVPELPEGVTYREAGTEITVTVSLEGLSTRTIYIPVDRILRENDDPRLDFAAERIPIVFRGKTEDIHQLNLDRVHVTVDMENDFISNNMTVTLTVTLDEGLDCGVFGRATAPVVEREETDPNETTGNH